jgi:hypothetical protein
LWLCGLKLAKSGKLYLSLLHLALDRRPLHVQDGLYPLLLKFIDVKGVGEELPMLALDLLAVLPTYPQLTQQLGAALEGSHKQQQLAALLDTSSDVIQQGGAGAAPEAQVGESMPYRTLYALQALCALLFPTFDEALLQPAADAEAMAEASACPSPVAGPGQGPGQPAPPSAATAAAACTLQHHREQQQQEFLQSRGLEVVLAAAQSAANANQTDLKLRRQLSELSVMLLHNLIDAAQGWANQAAAGSLDMMSGAESGAGAGAVTTAAGAGESGVASMAAASGAISSKDSQQASPDPQQQPDPASPSMEDAASSPVQPSSHLAAPLRLAQPHAQQSKQGSGKQQRHRAAELPPLPPLPGPSAAQGGTAAACQQVLVSVFGAHTLKLMASTLLAVAVETSQLWGTDSQPFPDDDSSRDVAVVKDAMQLLLRLLEQQPMLVQHLLLEAASSPLVTVVLVNPHYSSLRKQVSGITFKLALECIG